MTYEPNNKERRLERAYERLGTRDPKCKVAGCSETDPFALTGTDPNIYCAEHDAISRGVTPVEAQHPPGKRNAGATRPTRRNDHMVWDAAKRDWPEKTLRNPDGNPLRQASACVRTVLDWFREVCERWLGWIPEFLEKLDDKLEETFGRFWWRGWGLEGPAV